MVIILHRVYSIRAHTSVIVRDESSHESEPYIIIVVLCTLSQMSYTKSRSQSVCRVCVYDCVSDYIYNIRTVSIEISLSNSDERRRLAKTHILFPSPERNYKPKEILFEVQGRVKLQKDQVKSRLTQPYQVEGNSPLPVCGK